MSMIVGSACFEDWPCGTDEKQDKKKKVKKPGKNASQKEWLAYLFS